MAERIQRKRTKGWRMPDGAVYVGRPSKWGNPYPVSAYRHVAAQRFREWIEGRYPNVEPERRIIILRDLPELRGRTLACWCKPGYACHGDVLLAMANEGGR